MNSSFKIITEHLSVIMLNIISNNKIVNIIVWSDLIWMIWCCLGTGSHSRYSTGQKDDMNSNHINHTDYTYNVSVITPSWLSKALSLSSTPHFPYHPHSKCYRSELAGSRLSSTVGVSSVLHWKETKCEPDSHKAPRHLCYNYILLHSLSNSHPPMPWMKLS